MQYLSASFSPDGKWLTVSRTPGSGTKGNADVYVMHADGTGLKPGNARRGVGQLDRLGVTMKALVSILAIAVLGALLHRASSANPTAPQKAPSTVGTLAVASNRDGNAEIYLMTAAGAHPAQADERPEVRRGPVVSRRPPDRLLQPADAERRCVRREHRREWARNLTRNAAHDGPGSWSPDGKWLVFDSNRAGGDDIYVMRATGAAFVG